jgi:AraC-like DNA-binding protein
LTRAAGTVDRSRQVESGVADIQMSARIGAMVVRAATLRGASGAAIRARTGFEPALARDPDARITLATETALWMAAIELTGDPAIGLHAAETLEPGAFDVIEWAIRTAPTVRTALERLARYNRIEHDAAVFTIIDRGHRVRIEHAFRITGGEQCRASADFTIASIVIIASAISATSIRALHVELVGEAPASTDEHTRIFGVVPTFGAAVNAIELAASDVARPCPAADPALSRVIERHAEAVLARIPDPAATTAERVRARVAAVLVDGEVALADVAKYLKMSERSLQRRLGDEGRRFDELVDDLRHELAQRYLADPAIALGEIAYLLGYSEPSAFHRAFKRWTGTTPTAYRPAPARAREP